MPWNIGRWTCTSFILSRLEAQNVEHCRKTLRENGIDKRYVTFSPELSLRIYCITPPGTVSNIFCTTASHGFLPQPSLESKVSISPMFKRYSVQNEPSSTEEWIDALELHDGKKKKKVGEQEEFNDWMMKVSTRNFIS